MNTHMMGVGMAFMEMVLVSATGPMPWGGSRGREAKARAYAIDRTMAQPRISEEQLAALIPQEEGVCVGTARPQEPMAQSQTQETADKMKIFSFRETEAGSFELWELTEDCEPEMEEGLEDSSLMERIREL
jgi:hypothetical protein